MSSSNEELTGTAAEPWNTAVEKQKYQKTKGRTPGTGKAAIRNARRKAEMHELEKDRYRRLSKVDWRSRRWGTESGKEGIYVSYAPAETDARILAHIIWRATGEKTMVHMHGPGEACITAIYSDEKGVGTKDGTSSGVERLQVGCEWIGPKK